MYKYTTTVKLYDTDAAGLLFFGNHFRVAHDAYEAFMESIGLPLGGILRDGQMLLPVVQAKSDYVNPGRLGDHLTVELTCSSSSTHSFTLEYTVSKESGEPLSRLSTVHVCTDAAGRTKQPLPDKLKAGLEKLQTAK